MVTNISELVECVNIVDYISQYVDLEERGGEWWGLSPFTNEKTPSFSVNAELNRFYCFSSGRGGDLLQFIQLYHKCSFGKAIKLLQEYAGIDGEITTRTARMQATDIAKKFASSNRIVKPGSGIKLPEDYMDKYEWREDKFQSWLDEGITLDALKFFQVRYDAFSDRIVHPIRNMNGDIINVCGRTLDPDYKAKKLRKYTYFKPLGTLDTIYGAFENREDIQKKKEIVLFEGAKSVMKARGWGIRNCGAVLTSHVNDAQFAILIKMGVRVVFALDADVDVREDRNVMRLKSYTNVSWVTDWEGLLEPKDSPVDKGEDIFKHLYEQRIKFR